MVGAVARAEQAGSVSLCCGGGDVLVDHLAAQHLQARGAAAQQPLFADGLLPLQLESVGARQLRGQGMQVTAGLRAFAVEAAKQHAVLVHDQAIAVHAGTAVAMGAAATGVGGGSASSQAAKRSRAAAAKGAA